MAPAQLYNLVCRTSGQPACCADGMSQHAKVMWKLRNGRTGLGIGAGEKMVPTFDRLQWRFIRRGACLQFLLQWTGRTIAADGQTISETLVKSPEADWGLDEGPNADGEGRAREKETVLIAEKIGDASPATRLSRPVSIQTLLLPAAWRSPVVGLSK